MRRISAVLVATAAALALAVTAGSASARQCQAGFSEARGPSALLATGVPCAQARRVAVTVAQASPAGCMRSTKTSVLLRTPCVRLGFRCTAVRSVRKTLRVTCRSGARRIRFTY
ncbi:hypothetical protein FSW04_23135 [Baekduia soli]|uniref:Uncharacterized protein n=1 Tax=Baekduia soli TaxID=496014 RepID=A0A5B8UAJ7_9ACTN|nr:hypothetical protein [Baekduia soli]QEC50186.1 hypothetical protein FSW04_23135 [Baekduia soli]